MDKFSTLHFCKLIATLSIIRKIPHALIALRSYSWKSEPNEFVVSKDQNGFPVNSWHLPTTAGGPISANVIDSRTTWQENHWSRKLIWNKSTSFCLKFENIVGLLAKVYLKIPVRTKSLYQSNLSNIILRMHLNYSHLKAGVLPDFSSN